MMKRSDRADHERCRTAIQATHGLRRLWATPDCVKSPTTIIVVAALMGSRIDPVRRAVSMARRPEHDIVLDRVAIQAHRPNRRLGLTGLQTRGRFEFSL
jgi:hypothetical protein